MKIILAAPVRSAVSKLQINLRSIDSCAENNEIPLPNFIKLDVHSSELPALIGAKNSMRNCVGLLVETWNSEVHISQSLHHQIEKFALDNDFEVYDNICAARWQIQHSGKISKIDRARYIGSEILFFNRDVDPVQKLNKAFALAMFGHYNEAMNTIDKDFSQEFQILYESIHLVQN